MGYGLWVMGLLKKLVYYAHNIYIIIGKLRKKVYAIINQCYYYVLNYKKKYNLTIYLYYFKKIFSLE